MRFVSSINNMKLFLNREIGYPEYGCIVSSFVYLNLKIKIIPKVEKLRQCNTCSEEYNQNVGLFNFAKFKLNLAKLNKLILCYDVCGMWI